MWRRGSAKRVLGSAGLLERSAGARSACHPTIRPFRPPATETADAAFPSVGSSSAAVRRFTSPPSGVGSDDRSLYQNPSSNKDVRQQFQKNRNRKRGSSNNSPNWQAATNHNRNRKPDAAAIAEITSQLASLQYLIAEVGLEDRIPIWNYDHESTQNNVHADERDEILQQIGAVVDELRHYVFQKNILHPSGKHRHAFSAILERILGLYLQCSSSETQLYPNQIAGGNDSLLGLLQHFQMELTHRQCDLAVQVAAREGRFREAAQLYASHIDPDQGGYTPVTGNSSSTVETVIAGLYCMARGAALESGGGGMPTEQVFEGVLNLSLVSSSDTEKCKCIVACYCNGYIHGCVSVITIVVAQSLTVETLCSIHNHNRCPSGWSSPRTCRRVGRLEGISQVIVQSE